MPPRWQIQYVSCLAALLSLTSLEGRLSAIDPPRLDAAGDLLPDGALARFGSLHLQQDGYVMALAFSPDGRLLASTGGYNFRDVRSVFLEKSYGQIRIRDARTGRELHRLDGHQHLVRIAAFSPDGQQLTSMDDYGSVRVWDMVTSKLKYQRTVERGPAHLAFSSDGTALALCKDKRGRALVLWDLATGNELRRYAAPENSRFERMVLSPDGKFLAAISQPSGVLILDAATGSLVRTLAQWGRTGYGHLALSPDGRVLAATHGEEAIVLWDTVTGRELRCIEAPRRGYQGLTFSPDSKLLAAHANDQSTLWDVTTGKQVRVIANGGQRVHAFAFSPDGKTLARAENLTIQLQDLATGRERLPHTGHTGAVADVAFSPDGRLVASSGDRLRLWEAASGREMALVGGVPRASAVAFSPDGQSLLVGSADQTLRLWDVAGRKELRLFTGETGDVEFVALLPGGKMAASMSRHRIYIVGDGSRVEQEQQVRLWDISSGKQVGSVDVSSPSPLALSADGRLLATGMDKLRLWDVATGKGLGQLPGDLVRVDALALSADGRLLAVGFYSSRRRRELSLRETASGREIFHLADAPAEPTASVLAFHDRVLASGRVDGTILLWDVDTGKVVRTLRGHQGPVQALAFAPDSRRLVSGSSDTTALIWDLSDRLPAPPALKLPATDLPRLWTDLADDAGKAHLAAGRLACDPVQTVPFLRQRLRSHQLPDPKHIARLVADLDDDRFAVRERASAELTKLGKHAQPALRHALDGKPTAELRVRAQALLAKLTEPWPSADELQLLRALAVLERVATPEARQVITELARGPTEWRLTKDAAAALERLARRDKAR
jgi:WD40 repeat protein